MAKIKALNEYIISRENDQAWDTLVSQLVSLMPADVHNHLLVAMLDALSLDPGDTLVASCEFVLGTLNLGFTAADALLATSLRNISKAASEVANHDEILSMLKLGAEFGKDGRQQDSPGPSYDEHLSQMQEMMVQMQSMMATFAAKGAASPANVSAGQPGEPIGSASIAVPEGNGSGGNVEENVDGQIVAALQRLAQQVPHPVAPNVAVPLQAASDPNAVPLQAESGGPIVEALVAALQRLAPTPNAVPLSSDLSTIGEAALQRSAPNVNVPLSAAQAGSSSYGAGTTLDDQLAAALRRLAQPATPAA